MGPLLHILEENDPYGHLKSIHNGDQTMNFDHRKPWVSHVCIQNWDVKRTPNGASIWQAGGQRRAGIRGQYLAELGQHHRARN